MDGIGLSRCRTSTSLGWSKYKGRGCAPRADKQLWGLSLSCEHSNFHSIERDSRSLSDQLNITFHTTVFCFPVEMTLQFVKLKEGLRDPSLRTKTPTRAPTFPLKSEDQTLSV